MPLFEKKADVQLLKELKQAIRSNPEDQPAELGRKFLVSYPDLKLHTLQNLFSMLKGISDEVFGMYEQMEVSYAFLHETYSLPPAVQKLLAEEASEGKGLQTSQLREFRRCFKEGMSVAESLARAQGEGHKIDQRKEAKAKTLDALMDDIAKQGSKWRASVSLAMESVSMMEQNAGITLELFEKVYMLRHLIGEHYEFVNQKVNRFINTLKRRASNGGSSAPGDEAAAATGTERDEK